MALGCSHKTKSNINLPDAYIKIARFYGDKTKIRCDIHVFESEQARLDNAIPVEQETFEADFSEDKQVLNHLYFELKEKKYKGAIDK